MSDERRPDDFDIETLQPEAMNVGRLNRVVRALRERLYQARLKLAAPSDTSEAEMTEADLDRADYIYAHKGNAPPACGQHDVAAVATSEQQHDEACRITKAHNPSAKCVCWTTDEVLVPTRRPQPETGWLIEIPTAGGPAWWNAKSYEWTKDSLQAVRFARKQDAEMVRAMLPDGQLAFTSEHQWGFGAPPAPTSEPGGEERRLSAALERLKEYPLTCACVLDAGGRNCRNCAACRLRAKVEEIESDNDSLRAEIERLQSEAKRAIDAAGEALGTHPDLRTLACVEVLAQQYERLKGENERLLYTSDKQTVAWKERAIAAESALSSARARIEELERALLRIEGESAKDCSCDAVARAALHPRPFEGSEKR